MARRRSPSRLARAGSVPVPARRAIAISTVGAGGRLFPVWGYRQVGGTFAGRRAPMPKAGREGRLHRVHARALEGHTPLPPVGADGVEQRLAPAARRREQHEGERCGSRVEGRRACPAELEDLRQRTAGSGMTSGSPRTRSSSPRSARLRRSAAGPTTTSSSTPGCSRAKSARAAGRCAIAEVLQQADAALPGERLVVLFENGPGLVVQLQDPFGVREQLLAVRSRPRPAGVPDDELLSDDLFQPLDALADHRLGQAERGRAAGDAARPDGCREAAQVGDLQVILH